MNCCVRPLAIDGPAGVTAIEVTTAGVTVNVAMPLTPSSVAVIVEKPTASVEARPVTEMVAMVVFDDVQATESVMSCVEPSVYVPVASNCWVRPLAMLGLAGVSVMRSSTAAVTVSVVVPVRLPSVAVIDEVPCARVAAKPCEPDVLEIVATEVLADTQVTWLVRLAVELSE